MNQITDQVRLVDGRIAVVCSKVILQLFTELGGKPARGVTLVFNEISWHVSEGQVLIGTYPTFEKAKSAAYKHFGVEKVTG